MLILVVEKGGPHVRLLSWGLQEAGYEVLSATDFPDWEQKDAVHPDVIVLNSHMEPASKTLWVNALRSLVEGVKIIDLTTQDPNADDTGADAYVHPPHRVQELVDLITRMTGTAPPAESVPK